MQDNKELFEEWFMTTKWFTGDNCSPKYQTYRSMLEAWQASTSRDGYKLLPVEPTEEMLDASRRRQWDDLSSPYEDMDMLKYKAMIGAYNKILN